MMAIHALFSLLLQENTLDYGIADGRRRRDDA